MRSWGHSLGKEEAPRVMECEGWQRTVLIQICLSAEGLKKLFSGASVASCRGALVTVGQVEELCWAVGDWDRD